MKTAEGNAQREAVVGANRKQELQVPITSEPGTRKRKQVDVLREPALRDRT